MDKRLKDPIYGYIGVPEEIVNGIIDKPAFQRLRDVVQTSYAPLYASAVHNRFVHSLGVYYLGKMVSDAFCKEIENKKIVFRNKDAHLKAFVIACLLHDVGHAPFSHTGEIYYLRQGLRNELHTILCGLVGDKSFLKEINDNSYKAAPHEIMSAIIGIKYYGDFIGNREKSFFARCITGYKYTDGLNTEKSLLNILIELLNSSIIDVDKLDYLIRDAYMIGFDTVSIDYSRLLKSIAVVKSSDNEYCLGYYKSAVSVIENVVYAHDSERKWIQTHPSVLYEISLIQSGIREIINGFPQLVIPLEALTNDGVEIKMKGSERYRVCYLSDADMLSLFKSSINESFISEYIDRSLRRHPLWKSEAEFRAIFSDHSDAISIIIEEIEQIKKAIMTLGLGSECEINDETAKAINDEHERFLKIKKEPDDCSFAISEAKYKRHLDFIDCFMDYSKQQGIEASFLIIDASQFRSGFNKKELENIKIIFPEMREPCSFGKITNVLKSESTNSEKFFYVFCKKKQEMSIASLVKSLIGFAMNVNSSEREIRINKLVR